ncbi:hypothetical protein EGW08_006808 [Elysia chlorotica]|uniref:Uncharacterized protein n=1 Tax=Elysia chlorotica TaxID=188477 RepID=A0A433TV11_ELYCH|nr:hypothetical protein EGW08_006808 [Elysia chlorotica]
MDVEDQLTVLAAASSLSLTRNHVFFTFAFNPYDATQNSVPGVPPARTLSDVFKADPQNKGINILESLLVIAPEFPTGSGISGSGGAGDGADGVNLRRRRDVRFKSMPSSIDDTVGEGLTGFNLRSNNHYRSTSFEDEPLENKSDDILSTVTNYVDPIAYHDSNNVKDVRKVEKISSSVGQNDIPNVLSNTVNSLYSTRQHSFQNKSLLYIPEAITSKKSSVISQLGKNPGKTVDTNRDSISHNLKFQTPSTQNPYDKNHLRHTTLERLHQNLQKSDMKPSNAPRLKLDSKVPTSSLLFHTPINKEERILSGDFSDRTFAQARGQKVKRGYTGSKIPPSLYKHLPSALPKSIPLLFTPELDSNSNKNSNQASKRTKTISVKMDANPNLQKTSRLAPPAVHSYHGNADDLHREKRAIQAFMASEPDVDAIYDTVLLISLGVHKHAAITGAIPTPNQFMDAVENLTVQGRLGQISVGVDRQVAYDFKVYDFDASQGTMEIKMAYQRSGLDQWTLSKDLGISWPDSHVPEPDECFKQVPGCNDGLGTAYIIAVVIAVITVLTILMVAAYYGSTLEAILWTDPKTDV